MESLNDRGWTYHGMSANARKTTKSVLNRYWQRHISDKTGIWYDMPRCVIRLCGTDLHAAIPNAKFTLMDKAGGWNDEQWIGPKFAACLSYTKAVSGEPSLDLDFVRGIIVESVCNLGDCRFFVGNVWITDTNVTLKEKEILEALDYEIDVPCPLQWGLLWFSAPINLNHKFTNNGINIEKFRTIVIELSVTLSLTGLTPQEHCLYGQRRCCCAVPTIRDWEVKEEMQGWMWLMMELQSSRRQLKSLVEPQVLTYYLTETGIITSYLLDFALCFRLPPC